MSDWWNKGLNINGDTIPTPSNPMGHRLPNSPSARKILPGLAGGRDEIGEVKARPPVYGDDWQEIQNLEKFGGPGAEQMLFEKPCIGCGTKHRMVIKRAFLKDVEQIKWICSSCQATGFIWASDIPPESWVQYQIVKTFDDDTLMRHMRFSPNHQEAIHKPIDEVELAAKGMLPLKRKKKKFY